METPTFRKLGDLLENLFEFDDECNAPSFHDLGKLMRVIPKEQNILYIFYETWDTTVKIGGVVKNVVKVEGLCFFSKRQNYFQKLTL